MTSTWWVVEAGTITAAVVTDDDKTIVQTAPVLRWALGKHLDVVRRYAERKGGRVYPLPDSGSAP